MSWAGSYGAFAHDKAVFLDEFMRTRETGSVIEFGRTDGSDLSLTYYPTYIDLDVSRTAMMRSQCRFAADPSWGPS